MTWQSKRVKDLITKDFDGSWGSEAPDGEGVCVIRSTDMRGGAINFDSPARRLFSRAAVKSKKLLRGDILVNKSSGSSRLVGASVIFLPPDNAEYLCSNFIRCIRPDQQYIDCEFLYFALQSPDFRSQVFGAQRTTSGLRNLKFSEFKEGVIQFPASLSEQRRIARRIKQSLGYLDEIRSSALSVAEDFDTLKRSLIFDVSREEVTWIPVGNVVTWAQETEDVQADSVYHFAGVRSFGRGVFASVTRNQKEFQYRQLRRLKKGDFIYPKLMAWEGAFGMVPGGLEGFVVSPEFVVFRPNEKLICAEVLDTYFRSPFCIRDVRAASTGSNQRRRRLNPKEFLKLRVPIPTQDQQAKLREVYRVETSILAARSKHASELDAVRDAILHKAFAGKL